MRQGLDKYSYRNGTVIKHKKDDFRVPELRFPNFRIRDFEPQEYSAEMDYFAEQVENMNPQSKQLCDEIWEALGGSFDQNGNPIRVNEAQLELSYEFEKNENIKDDTHRNDDATEIDPDNISVSPEVIKQIYEMAIRGELPSDNG